MLRDRDQENPQSQGGSATKARGIDCGRAVKIRRRSPVPQWGLVMSDDVAAKNQKYLDYLNKHAQRLKMWRDVYGDRVRPPIWEDEAGNVQWANRAQRRKAMKGK